MAKNDNNNTDDPFKYGVLNPISDPKPKTDFPRSDGDGPVGGALNQAQETVRNARYDGEISVDGEYNGVVLATSRKSGDKPDQSSNWGFMWNFLSEQGAADKGSGGEASYFVRVPEIHAMNPIPESEDDTQKIELHDEFVDHSKEAIGAGDIVRVSFYNSQNVWMPQIIEKVGETSGIYSSKDSPQASSGVSMDDMESVGTGKDYNAKNIGAGNFDIGAAGEKIDTKTKVELIPPSEYQPYTPNRVRMPVYGPLKPENDLAVPVTSVREPPDKMHFLAAKRFEKMVKAAKEEGFLFYCVSGLRDRRWKSWQHYVSAMKEKYDGGLSEGLDKIAFASPHETGLAVDIMSQAPSGELPGTRDDDVPNEWGLQAESDTDHLQRKTPEFKWLQKNAHQFGFTPYTNEAWHWEVQMPLESFYSGEEWIGKEEGFDYRVREMPVDSNGNVVRDITTATDARPGLYPRTSNWQKKYPILKYVKNRVG